MNSQLQVDVAQIRPHGWRLFSAIALAMTLSVGCSNVTDAGHIHSGCTAAYNTAWGQYVNAAISHSDYRSCPVGLNPGQTAASAAVVYDNTAGVYPYGTTSTIAIYSEPNQLTYTDQSCSDPLAGENEARFYWGQARPFFGVQYEWRADPQVLWTVAQTPEFVCHRVISYATSYEILAVITINYWGEQW